MSGAFVWQGFHHEWLRTALGFRLPHRISRLDSFIDDAGDSPRFCFGQATGVDGNFMRPVGYYAALDAPGVSARVGAAELAWTDEIVDDPVPHAASAARGELVVDTGDAVVAGAVLRGFSLTTRCDPDKQPPELPRNSDGMWPYVFRVGLGEPRAGAGRAHVPVEVDIHRGWTPMRGGVPGIEEKPLNRRLDFRMSVHVAVLTGPPEAIAVTRAEPATGVGRARDRRGVVVPLDIPGGRFPHHAIGVTSFGFELPVRSERPRHQHRGRYIGSLRFCARSAGYDADTGIATVEADMGVWVPRTVVPTDVRYQLGAALIQLGEGATVTTGGEAVGCLCSNSAPEAPLFSHWKRCGSAKTGPEQDADSVAIGV